MFLRVSQCIHGPPTERGAPSLVNHPQDLAWLLAGLRKIDVLPPLLLVKAEIIFLTLQIPIDRMHQLARAQGYRNTLQPFNALFARNASLEHTIYDPIYVHTPMNGHSCVPFVARHLQDNTIASAMKDFTVVRKSLFVKANFARHLGRTGVVDVGLQELMRLVGISVLKQAGCASNLF